MKILFIQLPLVDHSHSYISGNIEYGPASIAGYIKLNIERAVSIQYLPFILSCFGSNFSILNYINNINPDIVSFTCYLWNVERSLNIASKIKLMNGNIKIFMGGPEINSESWALSEKRGEVDCFVSGEGEWFYRNFIKDGNSSKYAKILNGNFLVSQKENQLILSHEIVEPYTSNYLNPMYDGSIFLELTRGCPYKCIYCYYSKNCKRVRELSFQHLLNVVLSKEGFDINEIYILSPTFNSSPDFMKRLELLAGHNRGIKLHTEMRAGGIDDFTASLMYRAGFRSLEVGLQTMNKQALKEIGRHSETDKEVDGMLALKRAGIDLKIGIIPGLPGDSPDMFLETVNRMSDLGFRDNIELYQLMILPGTGIRDRADKDGVKYQNKPPYYLTSGWNFDYNSLRDVSSYVEKLTGYGHFKRLPDFNFSDDGDFVSGIYFNGDEIKAWNGRIYDRFINTNPFSYFVNLTGNLIIQDGLKSLFNHMSDKDQLYNIIFISNIIIDEKKIMEFLYDFEDDHFFRRLNIHGDWETGSRIKFYQVFDNIIEYARANGKYCIIDPIYKITKDNYSETIKNDQIEIDYLLISSGMFLKVKKFIGKRFSEEFENIAFENEMEQKGFYELIKEDYLNLKLPFKKLKF